MRKRKAKILYTAHGWVFRESLPFWTRTLYFLMERIAARGRDGTIVLSKSEKGIAARWLGIPAERLAAIPHGLLEQQPPLPRDAALRELMLPADERLTIGVIANFYRTKGLDVLLAALARPELSGVPFRLAVIGDGPERPMLEAMIGRLDMPRRSDIRLLGGRPDAARCLAAFDLFVLPSRKEGLPFVLLEALAAGLPIIATDVGAVRETLAEAGIIVPPGDPARLAEAIRRVLTDQKLRASLVEKSRSRAADLRDRGRWMIEETWTFYSNLESPTSNL
jgi:glycosyltransferase involved in cell wall biosynthesis